MYVCIFVYLCVVFGYRVVGRGVRGACVCLRRGEREETFSKDFAAAAVLGTHRSFGRDTRYIDTK